MPLSDDLELICSELQHVDGMLVKVLAHACMRLPIPVQIELRESIARSRAEVRRMLSALNRAGVHAKGEPCPST